MTFYIIILLIMATCSLDVFCDMKLPKYSIKTEEESNFYNYLMFMFFLTYVLIYYWIVPKESFWLFLTYLFCAIDWVSKSSDIVFHLWIKARTKKLNKPIKVKTVKTNKRK